MKASDLRVNNYVSVKESELKSFLDDYGLQGIENSFEVVSIDNVYLNILIDGLECEYYLSDCEPIPLTEEWLKRFGFDFTPSEYYVKNDFSCFFGFTDETAGKIIFASNFKKRIIIKYVHQLQNLYHALTGEELELKPLQP